MGGSILYGVVTNVYDREAVVARKECGFLWEKRVSMGLGLERR